MSTKSMIRRIRGAVMVALAAALMPFAQARPTVEAAQPLAAQVTITRDTFGVPHIMAATEEAAGFGLGYAQAEDHAEALARRVLRARGEAARHFGPTELANDVAMRRLDNIGESRRHLADLDGTYRRVLAAFADGVNRYVGQHRTELPQWVPEFTAADFLATARAGAADSVSSPALVARLEAKYGDRPARQPGPFDEAPGDEPGSNALAVSGRRTVSGKPILLGNPHLRWSNLYWEAHVTVPGRLDFYGSTLVALPWLRAGFNERLAYVQTNNTPDLEDVFALPLDPARPDSYVFDGRSRQLTRVPVSVDVRRDDGTLANETRTFWMSHLGAVVHRSKTHAFALRSTSLDAWRFFEGFWRLSHARSIGDFRSVLAKRLMPSSNFTYADAAGNILYVWNARLPVRVQDGTSYDLDVPGGDRRYVWRRLHPLSALPQLLNPPGGYIQNANNPPWFVSRRDPLAADRFPAGIERGELALRPQLATELLEAREQFSVEDVRELKFNTRLLLADRVRADLIAAADAVAEPSEDLRTGRRVIGAWDGTAAAASVGTALFQRFWDTYRTATRAPFARAWNAEHPYDTPSGLADAPLAAKHLEEAVRWTRETYGSPAVAWGDVNRFRFGDIDLAGDGASGQLGAYRVVQFDAAQDGHRVAGRTVTEGELAGFGDAWVLLVHFTRPVQAWSILAYGQSSRTGSLHGRDQIRLFAGHELRPVWFRADDIALHVERRYKP